MYFVYDQERRFTGTPERGRSVKTERRNTEKGVKRNRNTEQPGTSKLHRTVRKISRGGGGGALPYERGGDARRLT